MPTVPSDHGWVASQSITVGQVGALDARVLVGRDALARAGAAHVDAAHT